MTYKIMKKTSSSTTSKEYWSFVKVDSQSVTDFETDDFAKVDEKIKELDGQIPFGELKVVTEIPVNRDYTQS